MLLPLLVLGGGDRRPSLLPPEGRDKHPLTGCKGVDVTLGGRRLVDVVLDRFWGSGAFGAVYVAGPARAYRDVPRATLVDTDGSFGQNLEVGIERIRREHPGSPIAAATCDVVPEQSDLVGMIAHYRAHTPCDLWFPLVRVPEDARVLGESAWKPRYRVVEGAGGSVGVLPGHLAIFDPEAMRLELALRLLQLAYESRNRSVGFRSRYLLRKILGTLVAHETAEMLHGRLPWLLADVVHCLRAAPRLRRGELPSADLDRALRRLFVRPAHRRAHPERRVLLPILDGLSLARDIDTVEEAVERGAAVLPIDPASVA
jgi:hypothetical protein